MIAVDNDPLDYRPWWIAGGLEARLDMHLRLGPEFGGLGQSSQSCPFNTKCQENQNAVPNCQAVSQERTVTGVRFLQEGRDARDQNSEQGLKPRGWGRGGDGCLATSAS
jgi:hypothetical protein